MRPPFTPPFTIEPLGANHDRTAFNCGEEALNRYFQSQISQDIRRRMTNGFVMIEAATGRIAGWYTLASASIPIADLPESLTKRLPRYPSIPAARIGRLAVDVDFQKRGVGKVLLADTVKKTLEAAPAVFALMVDAKNTNVIPFYERHGFMPLAENARTYFLPLATAEKILFAEPTPTLH